MNTLAWFLCIIVVTIKITNMKETQVLLKISTDVGFTAEFLRKLANRIEECGDNPTLFETFEGCAEISWPE